MDPPANTLRRSPRLAALQPLPAAVAIKLRTKQRALKATVAVFRSGRVGLIGYSASGDGGRSSRADMRSRANRGSRASPVGPTGLVGRTAQAHTARGGAADGCSPSHPGTNPRVFKKNCAAAVSCTPSTRGTRSDRGEGSPCFVTPTRYSIGSSKPGSAPYFKIRTASDYDSDIVKEEYVPEFTESELKEMASRKRK
jgi:hypothetical protein